jgi:hypothetical protein
MAQFSYHFVYGNITINGIELPFYRGLRSSLSNRKRNQIKLNQILDNRLSVVSLIVISGYKYLWLTKHGQDIQVRQIRIHPAIKLSRCILLLLRLLCYAYTLHVKLGISIVSRRCLEHYKNYINHH